MATKSKTDDVALLIHSVVLTNKGETSVRELEKLFRELMGHSIPYRENGFTNLESLLYSLDNIYLRKAANGVLLITPKVSEKQEAFRKLIEETKSKKKKSGPSHHNNGSLYRNNGPSFRNTGPSYSNNGPPFRSNTNNQYNNTVPMCRPQQQQPKVPLNSEESSRLKVFIDSYTEGLNASQLYTMYEDKFWHREGNLLWQKRGYRNIDDLLGSASGDTFYSKFHMGRLMYYPVDQAAKHKSVSRSPAQKMTDVVMTAEKYLPVDTDRPVRGTSLSATFGEVYMPDQFWLVVANSSLLDLRTRMASMYSGSELQSLVVHKKDIIIGLPVVTKYTDGCFYRAKVQKVSDFGGFAEVLCVDHGTEMETSFANMWYMRKDLMRIPVQAFEAKLKGIRPRGNQWTTADAQRFCNLVGYKDLTATVSQSNISEVVLTVNGEEESINQKLVNEGRAFAKESFYCENQSPETEQQRLVRVVDVALESLTKFRSFAASKEIMQHDLTHLLAKLQRTSLAVESISVDIAQLAYLDSSDKSE